MIAKKIKELRIQKSVTQDTVAKALNVSPQSVSKWELGITKPDIAMLVPIADYFNVTVDYLLRDQSSSNYLSSDKIIEIRVEKDNRYWRCDVKNISSRELAKLSLKVYFFDKDGNVIDCKDKLVYDLEPGMSKPELLITAVRAKVVKVQVVAKDIKFAP